jgi:Leucine-rich repeat (LRR) protein
MKHKRGRRYRVGGASVLLVLVLAGCGGGNQPSGSAPGKDAAPPSVSAPPQGDTPKQVETPMTGTAPEKSPAFEGGATTPVSAQEAARLLDLRTFPRLPGADVQSQRLGEVTYTVPGTIQQAADFCVKHLTDAGWKEPPGERRTNTAAGREYQYFVFTKQGHILSATIWAADKGVGVSLRNSGNFDTRTLPRMKDAVLTAVGSGSFPIYTSTMYTTEATVNEVIEFLAKEVAALGWQEYVAYLRSSRRSPGSLNFRKRATHLAIYAYKDREKPGKTNVSYSAGLLTDDIPTMPDAVSLRVEDGEIFQLRYETPAAYQPVIDFYKKELPALGWKYREGAGLFQKESTFFYFDGDNKHYLSVDLKPAAAGRTLVNFADWSPELEAAYKQKLEASRKPAATPEPEPAPAGPLVDTAIETAIKKLEGSLHRDKQSPGQPIIAVQLGLSKCTDADLKTLAELRALGSLTLYRTAVTDAGLKELAVIKTLTSLDLGATKITDAGLKELAGLPALEQLTLNGTQITGAGLKDLAPVKKLRSLSMSESQLTDESLKAIGELESLHSLDLSQTKITGSGLKELSRLKSLETLSLGFTGITDSGLQGLPKWPELQHLSLYRTAVTDAGLKELAGLASLQTLALSQTGVTGSGLKELTGKKSLERLELSSAKVTDEGLKGLAGFAALEMLDLDGNPQITDTGLKELYGLTSLQSLNLSRTKVTKAGVDALKKALPECQIRN